MTKDEVLLKFVYEDYDCVIREISIIDNTDYTKHFDDMGINKSWLCGYVKVPKGHRLSDYKNYDEANSLEVHGGVTFIGDFDEEFNLGSDFWIGFDCNHAFDTREEFNSEYVVEEIKKLVKQIKEREKEPEIDLELKQGSLNYLVNICLKHAYITEKINNKSFQELKDGINKSSKELQDLIDYVKGK
jgi:hypothetical protein